jgi:hypothetical protein
MIEQTLLVSAIVTLASAVGVLFGLYKRSIDDTRERLRECERDRSQLWKHIGGLENSVKKLNGNKDPKEEK